MIMTKNSIKAILLPLFGLLLAAGGAQAQACPDKVEGPDVCKVVTDTTDTSWVVLDIAFKKPQGDLESAQNKALQKQYTWRLYGGYVMHNKANPEKRLDPPADADMKWEYTGFYMPKYFVRTLSLDDMIAKLTYRPAVSSIVRGSVRNRLKGKVQSAFTLDGRRIPTANSRVEARMTESARFGFHAIASE